MKRVLVLCVLAALLLGSLVWIIVPMIWQSSPSVSGADEPFWVSALAETSEDGFDQPSAGWSLTLPADHGAHPETRTESWSLAAHLTTSDGEDIGVQFVVLRIGVMPPRDSSTNSIWSTDTLYRAHVILTEASGPRAVGEERFGRRIPDLVGYDAARTELRLDNWVLDFGDGRMDLTATVQDDAILRLSLQSQKSPLSPDAGAGGAAAPVVGYGITRLSVEGTLEDSRGTRTLTGTAWFDHLWGQLPLPGASPVAWDRLQLQLADGTDLSLARSRRRDGRGEPILDGFAVSPGRGVSSLNDEGVRMTSSRSWQDPETGISYPVEWRLSTPGLDLTVEPVIDAQAFDFAAPVWSGLVRVSGTHAGEPVSGSGTMQLTGYSKP